MLNLSLSGHDPNLTPRSRGKPSPPPKDHALRPCYSAPRGCLGREGSGRTGNEIDGAKEKKSG